MHYKYVKKQFSLSYTQGFNKFDGALMVVNMETTRNVDAIMANEHIAFLESETCFSWDGAIFWFKGDLGRKFLTYADNWFQKNHEDLTDEMYGDGLSNILLYAYTKTGMAFVDTQRDMDSVIDQIVSEFLKVENIDRQDMSLYFSYDDSHLIDNLCFGRDVNTDGNKILYFLYEEGFLDESIMINSLYNNYDSGTHYSVYLAGDFYETTDVLEDAIDVCDSLTLLNTHDKNAWVWVGNNVSEEELVMLKDNSKKVSTIRDVVKEIFEKNFND